MMGDSNIKHEVIPPEMQSPPPSTGRGDVLPTPPTSNPNYSPQAQTPSHSPHTNPLPHMKEENESGTTNESSGINNEEEYQSSTDDELYGNNVPWPPRKRRRPYRPAYYYPTDHTSSKSKGCPVFEPTMEEFRDFYSYVNKIEKYGMRSGIVKIVPPKEWSDALPSVSEPLKDVRLKEPIVQHFTGSKGLFRQINIAKTRYMNPLQWKQMCDNSRYNPPNFFNKKDDRSRDSEQRKRARESKSNTQKPSNKSSKAAAESLNDDSEDKTGFAASPNSADDHNIKNEKDDENNNVSSNNNKPTAASPEKSQTPKRKKMTTSERLAKSMPSKEEWDNFDYTSLDHGATKENFTPEICREIEKQYWRRMSFGESPLYGADMQGSLFTDETKEWNVANLEDLFARLNPKEKIPGVNTPYLYFGMWRATFAWHVEDADLFSINYIHFGAPKFWYSIPQKDYPRFESTMAGYFAADFENCHQFIRHKSFIVSPGNLSYNGIYVYRMVQLPGEFIITFPHGYHSGFNLGYNCAESINFATMNWVEYGRKTDRCKCVGDSVRIDIDAWLQGAEERRHRELNQPQGEDSPVGKHNRRSRSVSSGAQAATAATTKITTKNKKGIESSGSTSAGKTQKPAKLPREYPCVLCPDTSTADLLKVSVNDGKPALHAHKICAAFTPTMWIDQLENGQEIIRGYENIEKARWNLKCGLCSEKQGVKIQCTKTDKCARSFHVTCALQEGSGVVVDAIPKHDGSAPDLVILCRQHNPAWVKIKNDKKREELRQKVAQIEIGGTVKVRTSGVFEVALKANIPERDVIVVMFADGKRHEIGYKSIIWDDANNNSRETPARYDMKNDFVYEGPKVSMSMSRGKSAASAGGGGYTPPASETSSVQYNYPTASTVPPTGPAEYFALLNGRSNAYPNEQQYLNGASASGMGGSTMAMNGYHNGHNLSCAITSNMSGSSMVMNGYPSQYNIPMSNPLSGNHNPISIPMSSSNAPYSISARFPPSGPTSSGMPFSRMTSNNLNSGDGTQDGVYDARVP